MLQPSIQKKLMIKQKARTSSLSLYVSKHKHYLYSFLCLTIGVKDILIHYRFTIKSLGRINLQAGRFFISPYEHLTVESMGMVPMGSQIGSPSVVVGVGPGPHGSPGPLDPHHPWPSQHTAVAQTKKKR